MASLEQVRLEKEGLVAAIAEKEKAIKGIQQEINTDKRRLEELRGNERGHQEKAFLALYGKTSKSVRKGYRTLVVECSGSAGFGHTVSVPGYIASSAGHVLLLPEHYDVCKPTPLIEEAFATVGQTVWIEQTPHQERWRN